MGIFASGQRVTAAKLNALGNSAGISNALTTDTTTSATYDDLPVATGSVSFTKLSGSTALEVSLHIVWFTTAVTTAAKFGVSINSTDYDVCGMLINEANTYRQTSGVRRIPGVAAGAYVVQSRWLRSSGAGTLTVGTDSWLSLFIKEVQ